jgi:hypothetical protein
LDHVLLDLGDSSLLLTPLLLHSTHFMELPFQSVGLDK